MVMAFLMFLGYDYKTARTIVKNARPIVNPNEGFIRKLKRYENVLVKANCVDDIRKRIK